MTLPPFRLERWFARWEFSVRHLLSSSDCESWTVAELLELEPGAREELECLGLGYTESSGDPALRRAIAAIYGAVQPEHVLVHAGAEEGIFSFMHVALEPGDHLVAHAPGYQSLYSVAESRGIHVARWVGDEERGWSLDPDDLERLVGPKTKAVVLNCPHNPTGYLMDRERFDAVVAICRKHGLVLFSDEVYRELEFHVEDRLPAACDVYERAVSLGVTSKTYGLPGLRIGWIATRDRKLLEAQAGFKDYLTICNSAPSELLARVALKHRETLAARNRRIVLENLQSADRFFARHGDRFRWRRPDAGPVAFVGVRGGGAEAFCRRVVEEAGVLLLPSTVFDAGDAHARFGLGRRSFAEALAALEDWLKSEGHGSS